MTATDIHSPHITYERVYPPCTTERINRLPTVSRWIFKQVLDAMQDAEEFQGPEGDQYVALMNAIIEEARDRRDYYRITLG
jgi:hypothetical protein